MVSRNVHQGDVGVSTSAVGGFVLLQTTYGMDQARASMTPKEAREVIARIREATKKAVEWRRKEAERLKKKAKHDGANP